MTHTHIHTHCKIFIPQYFSLNEKNFFFSLQLLDPSRNHFSRNRFLSSPSQRVKVDRVERHCESFSRFSTVAARMKTRSRLFRSFWRPLERGVSLSSTTVDSRFIETSHDDIPRRWWQSRSSRNRDYTVRFLPAEKVVEFSRTRGVARFVSF